jgi:hypothetical protein
VITCLLYSFSWIGSKTIDAKSSIFTVETHTKVLRFFYTGCLSEFPAGKKLQYSISLKVRLSYFFVLRCIETEVIKINYRYVYLYQIGVPFFETFYFHTYFGTKPIFKSCSFKKQYLKMGCLLGCLIIYLILLIGALNHQQNYVYKCFYL